MYSVKFKYMVGDKALDLLTGKTVTVVGTFYSNGQGIGGGSKFFHQVAYVLDIPDFDSVRNEEDLEELY